MDMPSARPAEAAGNEIDRPVPRAPSNRVWGSDAIAGMLRELDIPYIALNPGASYRGIHDSLSTDRHDPHPRWSRSGSGCQRSGRGARWSQSGRG